MLFVSLYEAKSIFARILIRYAAFRFLFRLLLSSSLTHVFFLGFHILRLLRFFFGIIHDIFRRYDDISRRDGSAAERHLARYFTPRMMAPFALSMLRRRCHAERLPRYFFFIFADDIISFRRFQPDYFSILFILRVMRHALSSRCRHYLTLLICRFLRHAIDAADAVFAAAFDTRSSPPPPYHASPFLP